MESIVERKIFRVNVHHCVAILPAGYCRPCLLHPAGLSDTALCAPPTMHRPPLPMCKLLFMCNTPQAPYPQALMPTINQHALKLADVIPSSSLASRALVLAVPLPYPLVAPGHFVTPCGPLAALFTSASGSPSAVYLCSHPPASRHIRMPACLNPNPNLK